MLKIILVFAELERQMTSERVTAVMISRAESGSWNGGKVPLGYVYNKEAKSFGIHPEQAEVVKLIYDSYERMQSSTAVSKFLNEKGITTKAGNKWNPSTVCLILRNPVYKGTMVYNKRRISVTGKLKPEDEWVTVENHHAAIIDAEQFERCHALLKKNMIGSLHLFPWKLPCTGRSPLLRLLRLHDGSTNRKAAQIKGRHYTQQLFLLQQAPRAM